MVISLLAHKSNTYGNIYYNIKFIIKEITNLFSQRCFPHIINLAVQAVLGAITDIHQIANDAGDLNDLENINHNVIAQIQMIVHKVSVENLFLRIMFEFNIFLWILYHFNCPNFII